MKSKTKVHLFEVELGDGVDPRFTDYLYRRCGGWQNVTRYGLENGNTIIEIPRAFADSVRCLLSDWEITIIKDCAGILTVDKAHWKIEMESST